MITDTDIDKLFTPRKKAPPPSRPSGHITCRVCDKPATVPIDHPALLCAFCLDDLNITRAHVAACVEAVLMRLDQAKAEWTEMLDFSPARDRWEKVQAAMIGVAEGRVSKDVLAHTWAKRKAEGGPLAVLLLAYERYARDTDQCAAELDKWAVAQDEINAAWMAKEV